MIFSQIYFRGAQFFRDIRSTKKISATRKRQFGAMSGIVSESTLAAEQLKISVTPDLERKWRIFEICGVLKSGCGAKFCRFTMVR
ncbi:MAG: hypothetical protein LBS14_00435 [Holosporaceae bacterium]|nr:hypothetical protein [Holosporaceae bacterium]